MADERSGPFDETSFLAEARLETGLSNFGDEGFRVPLRALLDSLADAPLNAVGTTVLRASIRRTLVQRLLLEDWWARHPEIADEPIDSPLVVVGMMRSGTTLVQRLLAREPSLYCAYGWEIAEPAPRPGTRWDVPDPRIDAGVARAQQMRDFAPDLYAIHPMDALEADEEIVFLADAFLSHVPEASCNVPKYRAWLDEQDFTPAYRHLRRTLQFLQWQKRQRGEQRERWLLKTPAHLGYLDTLFAVFPGARVVHVHRSPLETVPSGASLNYTLWKLYADHVDAAEVGRQWLERTQWATHRGLEMRDRMRDADERFIDVWYGAVVSAPLEVMERLHAAIGIEFTAASKHAIEAWLARDAKRKLPKHRYSAARFGLGEGEIRGAFGEYLRRFIDPHERAWSGPGNPSTEEEA